MPHSSTLPSEQGFSQAQSKESYKSRRLASRDTDNTIHIPLLRPPSWEFITLIHIPKVKRDSNPDVPKLPVLTKKDTNTNIL